MEITCRPQQSEFAQPRRRKHLADAKRWSPAASVLAIAGASLVFWTVLIELAKLAHA